MEQPANESLLAPARVECSMQCPNRPTTQICLVTCSIVQTCLVTCSTVQTCLVTCAILKGSLDRPTQPFHQTPSVRRSGVPLTSVGMRQRLGYGHDEGGYEAENDGTKGSLGKCNPVFPVDKHVRSPPPSPAPPPDTRRQRFVIVDIADDRDLSLWTLLTTKICHCGKC